MQGNSDTGSKKPHPQGYDHHLKQLTKYDEYFIVELVAEKPGIYLRELQAEVYKMTGTEISTSTICKFLHGNGFAHRKLNRIYYHRSDILRFQFMFDMSIIPTEMLVFLDESGSDRRDALRRYGYSLRGIPAKYFSQRKP